VRRWRSIGEVPDIPVAKLEALGLYDPAARDGSAQLELLKYLVGLGATAEDLVAYRDQLPGLASVVAIRGGEALTLAETAKRARTPEEKLRRLNRAAGFAEPAPGDRTFTEGFVSLALGVEAAESVFGEEAVMQLLRVMGSSMARVADACVSAFLVNVESELGDDEETRLGVARANAEAAGLLPLAGPLLDALFRQHLIAARRSLLDDIGDSGYETQRLIVGFVDIVASTALALRLSTRELGAALTEFENVAADTVSAEGGRVVKLIGDEILYTARDERSGCEIAQRLSASFGDHHTIPPVRIGLAAGEVLLRDGDVYGPIVNLAARAVKAADASEIVTTPAVANTAGIRSVALGERVLRGFDEGIELCRLIPEAEVESR
jgi:adenylate cyclase